MLYNFLFFFGGLSLFFYGINITSEIVMKSMNQKLEKLFFLCNKNYFYSLLTGILLTVILNSSSATSVLVIMFVSSKIINFKNSLFVIIGANIGTTFSTYIISLDVTRFFFFFIIIGICLILRTRKKFSTLGTFILGIGLFLMGLNIVCDSATVFIEDNINIFNIIMKKNNFTIIAFSSLITAFIQSSSVTIKIAQESCANNLLNLTPALCCVIGANIGTTFTGILASTGSNKIGKKIAFFNLYFNLFTSIIIIGFFSLISSYLNYISFKYYISSKNIINIFHVSFNIIGLIIFLIIFTVIQIKRKEKILTK